MTLPTSGPISLQDIANEFGGSHPLSMSNYYAGGPHVPSGTSGTNGPVPTSGPLNLTNFYGTSSFGPFSFNNPSSQPSGSSGGGPAMPITSAHTTVSQPIVITGGPTSGSFSYNWHNISNPSGFTIHGSGTDTLSVDISVTVGAQNTGTAGITCDLTITDTVSGLSHTVTGIILSWTFTNNTG